MTHTERKNRRSSILEFCKTHTVREAEVKYGISSRYISEICSKGGVIPIQASGVPKIAKNSYRIVARLCNTGDTLGQISRDEGISHQRICQIYQECLNAGVPVQIRLPTNGVREKKR